MVFLSNLYTVVTGLDNLKIDGYKYNYGSRQASLLVKIMKKEQKLDLQLGPKFNYLKDHELYFIYLKSSFRIVLHFNVLYLTYPAKSTDSNHTYEIDWLALFYMNWEMDILFFCFLDSFPRTYHIFLIYVYP